MDGFHRLQRRIGDFKILKRVTESYRRIRSTLSTLFANRRLPSTCGAARQMVEIDRYAMILARQLQERLVIFTRAMPFTLP